jgi:hypothetical protein
MSAAVSPASAVGLVIRLRLRRLLNQVTSKYNRPLTSRRGRPATAGKRRNPWLITLFVGLMMAFSSGNLAYPAMLNLHRAVDAGAGSALPDLVSAALERALTMQLSLLALVSFLMTLGARELALADWDLEWLVTLPMPTRTLIWGRLLERTVVNPVGWLLLWPMSALLAWHAGARWSVPICASLLALPLMLLIAVARTLVDTGLRLRLTPARLRNLQATASIASVVLLYIAMSAGMRGGSGFIFDIAVHFPAWPTWTPTGLAVRALAAPDLATRVASLACLFGEVAIIAWAGARLLGQQLSQGVVAASSRESARTPAPVHEARSGWRSVGSPIQRRELRLLARDRTFLVQTLVLPLVIVGSQVLFNGRFSLTTAGTSPSTLAAMAFVIAAYTLMFSAFQTLNSEGGALWILYTVPRSLAGILLEKAQLWSVLALAYPVGVFALTLVFSHDIGAEFIGLAAVTLVGVPIFAAIAVSLGVFGCNPLAQQNEQKLRPAYTYLYMLLASLYVYAIVAGHWPQRLVLIVLSALLALALAQKARDELPFLLDPAAAPPARVSTSDGLIAAMLFFVLQGLTVAILTVGDHPLSAGTVTLSYGVAGIVTFAAFRFTLWRAKAEGIPGLRPVGGRWPKSLAWGIGAGLVAAIGGVAYAATLQHSGLGPAAEEIRASPLYSSYWFVLLAIVAAPLCEEFIFRGLILGGLARSLPGAWAVVASAAVFAIVHPPVAMIPVFGLGICTAAAYRRTGGLLAPMLAHALYNGTLVAISMTLGR